MLKFPTLLSTLSNIAETRMNKGSHYVAHMSNLIEHLYQPEFTGPSRKSFRCGTNDPEKALVIDLIKHFLPFKGVNGTLLFISY